MGVMIILVIIVIAIVIMNVMVRKGFLMMCYNDRYGPGRQSRQQSLVKLGQLQQVSMQY